MTWILAILRRGGADQRGVAAIELALALPILVLLSLGAYDVSRMVEARIDLQQAAAQVTSLALARPVAGDDVDHLERIAMEVADLPADKVSVEPKLYCGDVARDSYSGSCEPGVEQARYLEVELRSSYHPMWRHFGIGETIDMTIARKVRLQ